MLGSIFGLENSTILAISLISNGPLNIMTSPTIRKNQSVQGYPNLYLSALASVSDC